MYLYSAYAFGRDAEVVTQNVRDCFQNVFA